MESFQVVESLSGVDREEWNALAGPQPFVRHEFLSALVDCGCAAARAGWLPQFVLLRRAGALAAAMPLFAKSHSYGEYVFDWAWAEAYRHHGRRYYPKLVSAIPFTPATGPRLLTDDPTVARGLVEAAMELAPSLGASSLHVLFPGAEEAARWERAGLLVRHGIQFHWVNPGYRDFDDYLDALNRDKRKKVRQERRRVGEAGVTLRRRVGGQIGAAVGYCGRYCGAWSSSSFSPTGMARSKPRAPG